MIASGRARSIVALLLLGAHVWLAPFAYADPPDPSWLGGIFDEADSDDVVLLVMAMTSVIDTCPVFEAPTVSTVYVDPAPVPSIHPILVAPARPIRAPPTP